ncbi:AAA family ATPase [Pseudomonas sp. NPDC086112]|uniref:AAA family ATPase n=1 Tax=Pseudomonas sp. NPDC086112 TaxID=3364430 RepID=UPI00380E58D5
MRMKLDVNNLPHPLLEYFELRGVNKYKQLTLGMASSIKIVAAENGTGKTTLLNALYAVLSKKLAKLSIIDFSELVIKFKDLDMLVVSKKDLFATNLKSQENSAFDELLEFGLKVQDINYIFSKYSHTDYEGLRLEEAYNRVYLNGPYDQEDTEDLFVRAMPRIESNAAYQTLVSYVDQGLDGVEVLYLPTFRRIEAEFSEFNFRKSRRNRFPVFELDSKTDDTLIWFGMADVEERLEVIRDRIKAQTFDAYSRLSVKSLEDLLSPTTKSPPSIAVEDKALHTQLTLVLTRLGEAQGATAEKLWSLIKSGEINKTNYDSLRSYLFQMLDIYTQTQADEQSIEGFAQVINNYWETSAFETSSKPEKRVVFDKLALSVDVRIPYSVDPLSLNDLSSGEKQIVSIFARLHLSPGNRYIVLIDEPELSLSLAWQRLFLMDILSAPSCSQLIAITHSPFIFDNDLDPFAEPLLVKYERPQE